MPTHVNRQFSLSTHPSIYSWSLHPRINSLSYLSFHQTPSTHSHIMKLFAPTFHYERADTLTALLTAGPLWNIEQQNRFSYISNAELTSRYWAETCRLLWCYSRHSACIILSITSESVCVFISLMIRDTSILLSPCLELSLTISIIRLCFIDYDFCLLYFLSLSLSWFAIFDYSPKQEFESSLPSLPV